MSDASTELTLAPLPWFAFNINEYLSDTSRLTTEGHGAYLLLVLELYQKAAPIPDDDDILAAITRMSIDAWKRQRKFLESFFIIGRDTVRAPGWWHARVERELRKGAHLMAQRVDASAKGNAVKRARASLAGAQPGAVKDTDQAPKRERVAPKTRPITHPVALLGGQTGTQADIEPEPVGAPHLHKQETPLERVESPPPEGETGLQGKEEPSAATMDLGMREIPDSWQLNTDDLAVARGVGMGENVEAERVKFIAHYREKGLMTKNPSPSWAKWCMRFSEHAAKQVKTPAPRVEVNPEIDWDRAVAMFKRNNSHWGRHLGPEPGQLGCKCPVDVIERAGLDPKTGLRKAS